MIAASLIAYAVALWTTGRFALGSLPSRRTARLLDRDRLRVLSRLVEAAALLLAVRAFVDWAQLSVLPWFVLVAVTAAGTAGAVLRWPSLPWLADVGRRRRRVTGAIGTVALSALVVGVVGL